MPRRPLTSDEIDFLKQCDFCGGRGFRRFGHGDRTCQRCIGMLDCLEPNELKEWFTHGPTSR